MAEDDGNWDTLVKRRALWLQSFWFVRGVMGTMALMALVPQVTALEQIEVLRALYALIIGWNEVMGWVGRVIGKIPFVPEIPEQYISTLVFFLALPFPAIIAIIRLMIALWWIRRAFKEFGSPEIDWEKNVPGYSDLAESEKKEGDSGSVATTRAAKEGPSLFMLSIVAVNSILISLGYFMFISDYVIPLPIERFVLFLLILILYSGVLFFIGVYLAISIFHGFKAGLLFSIGVIVTITVGYNIGTTQFSDAVNAIVCEELDIAPEDCSPEES